jgi:hypothetical protein
MPCKRTVQGIQNNRQTRFSAVPGTQYRPNQSQGNNNTTATKQDSKQGNSNPYQGFVLGEFQHFHCAILEQKQDGPFAPVLSITLFII